MTLSAQIQQYKIHGRQHFFSWFHSTNDTRDISQRRDESIQDTQTTVLPLVPRSTGKANGVSQRHNEAAQYPQKEAIAPSIHIINEGEESSRGYNMSRRGPATTILSHMIRNDQEKDRKPQRLRIVIQHS